MVASREKRVEEQRGGGVVDTVLLVVVKVVLVSVQGVVILEWILRKVLEALVWTVELGLVLIQPSR